MNIVGIELEVVMKYGRSAWVGAVGQPSKLGMYEVP